MFKASSLYQQLRLSHWFVTVLTALFLALCILLGYSIYASTGGVARWVATEAMRDAENLASLHEDVAAQTLKPKISQDYVDITVYPYVVPEERDDVRGDGNKTWFYSEIWMLVLSPEGEIVASNYQELYPRGQTVLSTMPPKFKERWLEVNQPLDAENPAPLSRSAITQNLHIGFAPIIDENNTLLGWIYMLYEDKELFQIIATTAQNLALAFLGAALIAVLLSAWVGSRLARAFSNRLTDLSQLSRMYAVGNFAQRYHSNRNDEISQVGEQLNRMAEQIETQLLELRDLAVLEERNRLARELHDAVKQQLFGLNLSLKAIQAMIQTRPDEARYQLEKASNLTTQALEEMDAIIQQLRPVSLEKKGLVAALQELLEQSVAQNNTARNVTARANLETTFTVSGHGTLPLSHEQCLYRIAQEGLHNIAKHARAKHVTLELHYETDDYETNIVQLRLSDDGIGFDVAQPSSSSLGLKSMKERAKSLGGTLTITSTAKGTVLTVHLPYEVASSVQAREIVGQHG